MGDVVAGGELDGFGRARVHLDDAGVGLVREHEARVRPLAHQPPEDALERLADRKAAAERKARKYVARAYDSFPIRHWDRWLDDMQIHLFVQGLAEGTAAHDLLAGTKIVQEMSERRGLGPTGR